jgi:hypothetical protein
MVLHAGVWVCVGVGGGVGGWVGVGVSANHFELNSLFLSIAYSAGINFDDGLGGGSVVTRNVLFNFCRESSDHGTSYTSLTAVSFVA